MKIVHAIDGNNWANRAFYAGNRNLSHNGIPTNAIHVFFNMLNTEIQAMDARRFCFAFDIRTSHTWRAKLLQKEMKKNDSLKAYKSDRPKDPETEKNKREQIKYIREILHALGYFVIDGKKGGDEADDIIGAVAHNSEDYNTYIHSNDKDFAQLLSKKCRIIKPNMDVYISPKNCKIVYGVKPNQVVDLLAMRGDGVDSISGIKGIGETLALNLLNEYGSFDNAIANIDDIKGREGGALRRAMEAHDLDEYMKLMRTLVTIKTDLDYVPTTADAYVPREPDVKAVLKLKKKLGLYKTSILKDFK